MILALEHIVQANNNFEIYSKKNSFQNSREGIFVLKIIVSVDTVDYDEISFLLAEYDNIKPLDKIQVKLLLKIKKNIGFIYLTNDELIQIMMIILIMMNKLKMIYVKFR